MCASFRFSFFWILERKRVTTTLLCIAPPAGPAAPTARILKVCSQRPDRPPQAEVAPEDQRPLHSRQLWGPKQIRNLIFTFFNRTLDFRPWDGRWDLGSQAAPQGKRHQGTESRFDFPRRWGPRGGTGVSRPPPADAHFQEELDRGSRLGRARARGTGRHALSMFALLLCCCCFFIFLVAI